MTINSKLEKDFEINAVREFEIHLMRYQELKRIEFKAGEDASSHQAILRSLAKLYPRLREQFNADVVRYRPTTGDNSSSTGSSTTRSPSTVPQDIDLPAPRGVDAVRQVLSTHEGEWFSVSEIHEMLEQARLIEKTTNSHRVLRNTLNRAINLGLVAPRRQNGSVFYCWKANHGSIPNRNGQS